MKWQQKTNPKKAEVTKVDMMASPQGTHEPKTWTSPRDLAYVPPPQTIKLTKFLNISIYSAVSWLLHVASVSCFSWRGGNGGWGWEVLEKILGMAGGKTGKTDFGNKGCFLKQNMACLECNSLRGILQRVPSKKRTAFRNLKCSVSFTEAVDLQSFFFMFWISREMFAILHVGGSPPKMKIEMFVNVWYDHCFGGNPDVLVCFFDNLQWWSQILTASKNFTYIKHINTMINLLWVVSLSVFLFCFAKFFLGGKDNRPPVFLCIPWSGQSDRPMRWGSQLRAWWQLRCLASWWRWQTPFQAGVWLDLPSLKLTFSPLKMGSRPIFRGEVLLVSGRGLTQVEDPKGSSWRSSIRAPPPPNKKKHP